VDGLSARDPAFSRALRQRVRGEVREGEPLARYSTYRIGGPATVVLPATAEDVSVAISAAHEAGIPWFALGLGSNVLLPDAGLDALVIRLGKGLDALRQDGHCWTLGAGLPAPLAARRTAGAGFAGLHVFVGVPGSVGGGVYMNAGCHGGDWSAVVERITVVDATGRDRVLGRAEVPFTYRRSGLDGNVVLETVVRLRPAAQAELDEQIAKAQAARDAIEDGLRCPHEDVWQCPNFAGLVTARLEGRSLKDAHPHGPDTEPASGWGAACGFP
jgi:UDP-N-acetylmuramate dehydrogenase